MNPEQLKKIVVENRLSKDNPSCQVVVEDSARRENHYTIKFNPEYSKKNRNLPKYFVINTNVALERDRKTYTALYGVTPFIATPDGDLKEDVGDSTYLAFEQSGKITIRQDFSQAVEKLGELIIKNPDKLNHSVEIPKKNIVIVACYNSELNEYEYFAINKNKNVIGTTDFYVANRINPQTGMTYTQELAVKILPDDQFKFIQHIPGINVKKELAQLSDKKPSMVVKGLHIIRQLDKGKPRFFAVKENTFPNAQNSCELAFLIDEESGLIDQSKPSLHYQTKINESVFIATSNENKYLLPSIKETILQNAKNQCPFPIITAPIIIGDVVHIINPSEEPQTKLETFQDEIRAIEQRLKRLKNKERYLDLVELILELESRLKELQTAHSSEDKINRFLEHINILKLEKTELNLDGETIELTKDELDELYGVKPITLLKTSAMFDQNYIIVRTKIPDQHGYKYFVFNTINIDPKKRYGIKSYEANLIDPKTGEVDYSTKWRVTLSADKKNYNFIRFDKDQVFLNGNEIEKCAQNNNIYEDDDFIYLRYTEKKGDQVLERYYGVDKTKRKGQGNTGTVFMAYPIDPVTGIMDLSVENSYVDILIIYLCTPNKDLKEKISLINLQTTERKRQLLSEMRCNALLKQHFNSNEKYEEVIKLLELSLQTGLKPDCRKTELQKKIFTTLYTNYKNTHVASNNLKTVTSLNSINILDMLYIAEDEVQCTNLVNTFRAQQKLEFLDLIFKNRSLFKAVDPVAFKCFKKILIESIEDDFDAILIYQDEKRLKIKKGVLYNGLQFFGKFTSAFTSVEKYDAVQLLRETLDNFIIEKDTAVQEFFSDGKVSTTSTTEKSRCRAALNAGDLKDYAGDFVAFLNSRKPVSEEKSEDPVLSTGDAVLPSRGLIAGSKS